MPSGRQQVTEIQTSDFGGLNTALQFSQIESKQSPKMTNGYMNKIGSIGKRAGTAPVANTLGAAIGHVTIYHAPAADEVIVSSGTGLYKYTGVAAMTTITMTNALVGSSIHTTAFTDASSSSVLVIADGGVLKRYNGTNVANITAAANDASPAPANILGTTLASKALKYCWTYSSHVFMSDGSDGFWYTKRYTYDYVPSVQYQRFVRENDTITGNGVAFNNVMLVPMRRGWGIFTGSSFDDFVGGKFLNTSNGCISARSIQRITYPAGQQAIIYLSDDGVYEVYDTGFQDTGARQYATRNTMANKIAFEGFGFTEAEKMAATAYYDQRTSIYMLSINGAGVEYTFALDARNGEWYLWTGAKLHFVTRNGDKILAGGRDGKLRELSNSLYSDWDDIAKTTGTPVQFERYGPLLSAEFSGFPSLWDEYMVELKQWGIPSSLDITIAFSGISSSVYNNLSTAFVWGVSGWGQASWTLSAYTDIANEPSPLRFNKMSKYVQVRWQNFRDEPMEIYREKWRIRLSGG